MPYVLRLDLMVIPVISKCGHETRALSYEALHDMVFGILDITTCPYSNQGKSLIASGLETELRYLKDSSNDPGNDPGNAPRGVADTKLNIKQAGYPVCSY